MGTISVSLPSDGQTADAADYNVPINTIVSEINGGLDSDNIEAGGVVPNSLVSGTGTSWAWQSWTPTWSANTVGNGTVSAKYIQIGKTVFFRIEFTLGSTSAIGSNSTFTLPVTMVSLAGATGNGNILGNAIYFDASASSSMVGCVGWSSTTVALPKSFNVSGANQTLAGVTSTQPFTWATGDQMLLQGFYEAA